MRADGRSEQMQGARFFIAATASAHKMTVATRDVQDIAATGVAIVNPWN
jgi:predicted nucleic acid-binding protein